MAQENILFSAGNQQISLVTSGLQTLTHSQLLNIVPVIAKTIMHLGLSVTTVIAKELQDAQMEITYYNQRVAYIRQDLVPIIALMEAHQAGRGYINQSGWDDDLQEEAQKALNAKRAKRLRKIEGGG